MSGAAMIPRHVWTLRFKLTVLNTLAFAALITGTCILFLNVQRRGLVADIDDRLHIRADTIIEDFAAVEDEGLGISGRRAFRPLIDPARFPSFFIQFRDQEGRIIFRSRTLQTGLQQSPAAPATQPAATGPAAIRSAMEDGVSAETAVEASSANAGLSSVKPDIMPTSQPAAPPVRLFAEMPLTSGAAATRANQTRHVESVRGGDIDSIVPDGHGLRMLSVFVNTTTRKEMLPSQRRVAPFYIQVALPLTNMENTMAGLRRNFVIIIPIGVLASGFASWLLARKSLSPIGRIAREARELTALRLDRRIAVPEGHDEVVDMTQTINEMLDRLEAAFRAQERFIADAAHELKTPVATALSGTQVLLQKARSMEEYEEFVASLQDELRRIGQMVDSLLTLARADAGLSPNTASPVSVNEIVMSAVESCQPIAVQREVRLVPRLAMPGAQSPELTVVGDDDLLHAMISNLIRNAIRYAPVESPVEVDVSATNGQARIAVRDSGPGIDPAYQSRIFDRFFQVPTDQNRLKGSGLGLAIAKGVARLHGGEISVGNRPTGGCEFIVTLPLRIGAV